MIDVILQPQYRYHEHRNRKRVHIVPCESKIGCQQEKESTANGGAIH